MATIGQYLQHTRYAVPFFLGGTAPAVAGAGYNNHLDMRVFKYHSHEGILPGFDVVPVDFIGHLVHVETVYGEHEQHAGGTQPPLGPPTGVHAP